MTKRKTFLLAGLVALLAACHANPKPAPPTPPTPPPPPPGPCVCTIPSSSDTAWKNVANPTGSPFYDDAVTAAEAALGPLCEKGNETDLLQKLAVQLVAMGVCAAQWADAVLIPLPKTAGPGYEQHHAVAYTSGCWTLPKNSFVGTWQYTAPIPGCANPPAVRR